MQVDNKNTNTFFNSIPLKNKRIFIDEFEAYINDIKEKESNAKQSRFSNQDLNLGVAKDNFISYAQQKMRQDMVKRSEENFLNKLFTAIDAMNA
ncbi:hypothetical protein OQH60_01180 [Campylobacter sp. MIT 21-1685]|uniref:hypothetical protein n=1 Tax=unclassified Campylobacter TaxID=2593542 RepID=UPI00224A4F64|nr:MULTISPECIES: hypothetical protein [unclassified Campylobacter]MCX2682491.1 hypothetical protein [Campylobacter sp. MIT 21-1684]MCX2750796.1 hypothetical protein [Campylobacter sp. MIT 21-1682]MCX2806972.1 hypothetical protein [Campylobacter sp. MIT 21-1685]